IWQSLLGIAPVGVRDSFFDLGGHSLLMTQMVAKLRAATKVTIPLRALVELPTIEQLAEAIRAMGGSKPADARESQLVEIQPGGQQQPLFCVHPLGGGVSVFIDLARHLGPDQPFYAFQAADLETLSKVGSAYTSIEEMASRYLTDLAKLQPAGPYHLAGLSFGGQVAFEMAHQLNARGETVAFLGLLDTYAPNPSAPAPDEETLLVGFAQEIAAAAGKDISLAAADLRPGNQEANLTRVLNLLKSEKLIAQNTDISTIRAFLNGVRTRIETSRAYRPKVYAGKVTLFRAAETSADLSAWVDLSDATYGWSRFSDREVDVVEVPGTHATICVPPQVEILARRLAAALKEASCAVPTVA
ncbi:MAG TPA: thioesterase domain-containing protein, partial [Blastocatellia bacterium]|nr:thioesterase domain-containing protein [Blastocatellia bacterium]